VPNLEYLKKLINYRNAFIITFVVFIALATINLVGTNTLSTQGIAVSEAEAKTIKLEKENHLLSVKIEESTRLQSLEELAEFKGFIRPKSIVFVPTPPTFASR
jgi:hypothetical protein